MTSPNSQHHTFSQSDYLTILASTPAESVKELAESVIPSLEPIHVVYNRTGLVMLPGVDTAQGGVFYLGEVLIAEARVQIVNGVEGYGACMGYDLAQALAIALLDAALIAQIMAEPILRFVAEQAAKQAEADRMLLQQ